MAELQEGGNPKEFMDNNGKKLEEIKQQKAQSGCCFFVEG